MLRTHASFDRNPTAPVNIMPNLSWDSGSSRSLNASLAAAVLIEHSVIALLVPYPTKLCYCKSVPLLDYGQPHSMIIVIIQLAAHFCAFNWTPLTFVQT